MSLLGNKHLFISDQNFCSVKLNKKAKDFILNCLEDLNPKEGYFLSSDELSDKFGNVRVTISSMDEKYIDFQFSSGGGWICFVIKPTMVKTLIEFFKSE